MSFPSSYYPDTSDDDDTRAGLQGISKARRMKEKDMWPAGGRDWYMVYSYSDLKRFVLNRRLVLDAPGLVPSVVLVNQMTRRQLINTLLAADKNLSFKFMMLPAELRNQVYSHLLIDSSQHVSAAWKLRPRCHPNILATNKAINLEATKMLYETNHISLFLMFHLGRSEFSIDCITHHIELEDRNAYYIKEYGQGYSATDVLHKPLITKVRHVNIHITIAEIGVLEVLEVNADIVKKTISELKDYMAMHSGREQNLHITFDVAWPRPSEGSIPISAQLYKHASRGFIATQAIEIMKPFTEFTKARRYAHLPGCQKTTVDFSVGTGIDEAIITTLDSMRQKVENEVEKEHKGRDYLHHTVDELVEQENIGRGTEKIIKKSWRETEDDAEGEAEAEDEAEDEAYFPSPNMSSSSFSDDDEIGKDDDSVTFDSDSNEQDYPDLEDLDLDEDYHLDDLIEKSDLADPIEVHPSVMDSRNTT